MTARHKSDVSAHRLRGILEPRRHREPAAKAQGVFVIPMRRCSAANGRFVPDVHLIKQTHGATMRKKLRDFSLPDLRHESTSTASSWSSSTFILIVSCPLSAS